IPLLLYSSWFFDLRIIDDFIPDAHGAHPGFKGSQGRASRPVLLAALLTRMLFPARPGAHQGSRNTMDITLRESLAPFLRLRVIHAVLRDLAGIYWMSRSIVPRGFPWRKSPSLTFTAWAVISPVFPTSTL